MASLQEIAGDEGVQLYKDAKHLSEVESKNDPSTEPFKSKYKARDLYNELKNMLRDKVDAICSEKGCVVILCIDFLLGQNYVDTEEFSEGEGYFHSIIKTLKDKEHDLELSLSLQMHTLNNLGFLASQRGNINECMDYFSQAQNLFLDWKENQGNDAPLSYQEYFNEFHGSEDEKASQRNHSFESTYTHTLYYLAQGFAKQEKSGLSAHYCHMTLQRQLKMNDYNPVDWGLNAATLSQYYVTSDKFPEARHCLSSGSHVFEQSLSDETELSEQEQEIQDQRKADLDRCWIKYGLALLEASRDKMLSEAENLDVGESESETTTQSANIQNDHNSDASDLPSGSNSIDKNSSDKPFEQFELELTSYEEKITDKLVRTYDEARKIFVFMIEKINSAQKFYTLDTHASDGVEIIQDNSKAYKLLAFFELDMQKQCIMHKRRVDMLSSILSELNPKYYLLVCRQLMFELAETYSTMADLKLSLIEMGQAHVSPHTTSKINKLSLDSIKQYEAYIDSLKDNKPELPEDFPPGDVRPALVAYFCIGRLYSKLIEPDLARRLMFMQLSMDYYKKVVDYCSTHSDAKSLVSSELSICEELVELMPLKMERLKQTALT